MQAIGKVGRAVRVLPGSRLDCAFGLERQFELGTVVWAPRGAITAQRGVISAALLPARNLPFHTLHVEIDLVFPRLVGSRALGEPFFAVVAHDRAGEHFK